VEGDWLAVADFDEEDLLISPVSLLLPVAPLGPDPFLPDSGVVGVEGTSEDLVAEVVDGVAATEGKALAQAATPISFPPPCRG